MGIDAIIVNKQDACGLTPAVSKVSSGALELTPIFQVKFVKPFLEDASHQFKFNIISTNIDDKSESQQANQENAEAKPIVALKDVAVRRDENLLLVLGSEGEGVSKQISELASQRVMIPPCLDEQLIGKYPFTLIDSLNVGVSAALMIKHIQELRKK